MEAQNKASTNTQRVVSPNSPHEAWVNEVCAKAIQQATARNQRYFGPSFGRTASSAYTPGSMWALTESGWVEIPEEITPLPLDFHNSSHGVAYSYPDQLLARDIIAGKKPLSAAGEFNIAQRVDVAQRYYASRISQNPDDYSDSELQEMQQRSLQGGSLEPQEWIILGKSGARLASLNKSESEVHEEPNKNLTPPLVVKILKGYGEKARYVDLIVPDGFRKVAGNSHGEDIFYNGKVYISGDRDDHTGGT